MKVLFVTNYYPDENLPQLCIFIHQQAKALKELGDDVDVIVPMASNQRGLHVKKRLLDGVNISYCYYYTFYKGIYLKPIFEETLYLFEKKFDFHCYDIISIHMFDEVTLRIFTRIAKKYHCKLVLHYHGLSVTYDHKLSLPVKLLQYRGDTIRNRLVSRADVLIGVSDKVCKNLKNHYNRKPVYTVYNGVDPMLFHPSSHKERELVQIISVASLKKIKGNHYLIEAFAMLIKKYPTKKLRLLIIGYGPEEAALRSLAKELHIADKVLFIGYISYEKVAKLMTQSDIFAMPSYYEALGCAYLEAMACRLPVIGCRHQGIDEIIKDGINGCLIEPHNVNELFEKLELLINQPDKAKELAQNGYQTVTSKYTWYNSAKRLSEIYIFILKNS